LSQREINPELHLVLLPGLDGTGKLFDPFIKQFPDPARVTVIPYPIGKFIPVAQLADYIISLLPTDKPLAILGESYSGPVALSLASRDDIDIRKVILVATFAKYPASFLKTVSKFFPLSLLFRLPIPDFVIRNYCFGSATNKTLSTLLRESVRLNKPGVLARRVHDVSSIDVTGLLADIKVPCLYIAASNDKLVPGNAIDHLKKHLPNLNVVTVQGAHFILQVQPKVCFDAVNDFLV
jgi:pimeloyl-ACP methyl ester carboxylesterase